MTGGLLRGTPGDNIRATPSGVSENVHGSTLGGALEVNVETPFVSFRKGENVKETYRPQGSAGSNKKRGGGADLKKTFKDAVKTPLTQRIIEFTGPEFKMPTNIKLYDGMTDSEDHLSQFSSAANSGEWPMPVWKEDVKQALSQVFRGGVRGGGVMKISSFLDAHKCLELAKRYSDKVPKMVDEMMTRLDDFVRSKEAFARMELPKGEASETPRKSTRPVSRREDRIHKGGYIADRRINEGRSTFNNRDSLVLYRVWKS
ncbi:hypothetical protein Tco_0289300 [Tanacetum coccineum]